MGTLGSRFARGSGHEAKVVSTVVSFSRQAHGRHGPRRFHVTEGSSRQFSISYALPVWFIRSAYSVMLPERRELVPTSDRKHQSALHAHGHQGEYDARRVRGGMLLVTRGWWTREKWSKMMSESPC